MIEQLKSSIASPLFSFDREGFVTSIAGPTNARYVPCTDAAKHLYNKIFSVFDELGLEYFVFAGALVGYVRNKKLPPWLDDMDVILFEDSIQLFEDKVVPELAGMGFNCRPVAKSLAGAGFHILGLQQSANRQDKIAACKDRRVSIPWFQVDIFYSKVDQDGLVKNLSGWGLYHKRQVQFDWFKNPQRVEMDGVRFPTISNVEDDVMEEYGDVCNELVVKTHGTTFLSAAHIEWAVFEAEFDKLSNMLCSSLPPSVDRVSFEEFVPQEGFVLEVSPTATFDDICAEIVRTRAGAVKLKSGDHIFWTMDLKRLFPEVVIEVAVSNVRELARSVHLSDFIDSYCFPSNEMSLQHEKMLANFRKYNSGSKA
jgi:hypothetical protein